MCLICIDFDRGKLTTKEARRAMGELKVTLDTKHLAELEVKLTKAELSDPKTP